LEVPPEKLGMLIGPDIKNLIFSIIFYRKYFMTASIDNIEFKYITGLWIQQVHHPE